MLLVRRHAADQCGARAPRCDPRTAPERAEDGEAVNLDPVTLEAIAMECARLAGMVQDKIPKMQRGTDRVALKAKAQVLHQLSSDLHRLAESKKGDAASRIVLAS